MKEKIKADLERLEEYRKKHKFTYKAIADMLETTTRSLNRWFKGDYIPLPIYRRKIAELLKINHNSISTKKGKRR